jgi:hypothetical protein
MSIRSFVGDKLWFVNHTTPPLQEIDAPTVPADPAEMSNQELARREEQWIATKVLTEMAIKPEISKSN